MLIPVNDTVLISAAIDRICISPDGEAILRFKDEKIILKCTTIEGQPAAEYLHDRNINNGDVILAKALMNGQTAIGTSIMKKGIIREGKYSLIRGIATNIHEGQILSFVTLWISDKQTEFVFCRPWHLFSVRAGNKITCWCIEKENSTCDQPCSSFNIQQCRYCQKKTVSRANHVLELSGGSRF